MKQLFAKLILWKKEEQLLLEKVPYPVLFVNCLFQRLFRLNHESRFSVHYTSRVTGSERLKINGKPDTVFTSFAASGACYIAIAEDSTLEIGEGTIWAWNVSIQTANHDVNDLSNYIPKSVKIGKKCWIGSSVTILPGVELGDNVIVGANSVVTKSFSSNNVIAGCPAKVIKEL